MIECSLDFQVLKSVKQILATSVSLIVVFKQHEHNVLIFPKNFETVFLKIHDKIFCSAYNFMFLKLYPK